MGTGEQIKQRLDELTLSSNQEKNSEAFEEVLLSEEETAEALRAGREKKYFQLKREEYNAKIRAARVPTKFTSHQIFQAYTDHWDVDIENLEIVKNLCHYFTEDPRFDGDVKKGLFLVGGVGIGKSTLMQFFSRNQKASYRLISCRDVESDFSSDGEKSVRMCSYNLPIAVNSDPFGHQEIGFCFDDLGTEANAKHYGHEKNVMAEIILNRYDNNLPYHCTHITTNLTADEIKAQYGTRVTDRIREMFNIIKFPVGAKSRRK